jgi:hypothetical protein
MALRRFFFIGQITDIFRLRYGFKTAEKIAET